MTADGKLIIGTRKACDSGRGLFVCVFVCVFSSFRVVVFIFFVKAILLFF